MIGTMPRYFDAKRDTEIINNDGFFCQACLVGRPMAERSPDLRYCHSCCDFLLEEAQMITSHRRPKWIPKVPNAKQNGGEVTQKTAQVLGVGDKQKEVLVDTKSKNAHAYQNLTLGRSKVNVGGRPKKDVPIRLIKELSKGGLSIGGIVKELKTQGCILGTTTVSRVLSGQRQ